MNEIVRAEATEAVDLAERTHEQILELRQDIQVRSWALGRLMKEMRDQAMWRVLGHNSFSAYLEAPEVGIKHSTAYLWITLYETYEERLKIANVQVTLADIDMQKLAIIRPVLTADNAQEWIGKARMLGRNDLRTVVEQAKEAKRAVARQEPPPPEGLDATREPAPSGYAAHNAALVSMMGEIIESAAVSAVGLLIRTDSGKMLRCWALGADVQVSITGGPDEEDYSPALPVRRNDA